MMQASNRPEMRMRIISLFLSPNLVWKGYYFPSCCITTDAPADLTAAAAAAASHRSHLAAPPRTDGGHTRRIPTCFKDFKDNLNALLQLSNGLFLTCFS